MLGDDRRRGDTGGCDIRRPRRREIALTRLNRILSIPPHARPAASHSTDNLPLLRVSRATVVGAASPARHWLTAPASLHRLAGRPGHRSLEADGVCLAC